MYFIAQQLVIQFEVLKKKMYLNVNKTKKKYDE